MLDLKDIEQRPEFYKNYLNHRSFDSSEIDKVLELNERRKSLIQFVESNRAEVKKLSQEVGQKKRNQEDASDLMAKVSELKNLSSEKEEELKELQDELNLNLSSIPNQLDEETPKGTSEDDNVEFSKSGEIPHFSFKVKDHVELGEKLGLLDFETGSKLTGSRFVVLKGCLAKLERALYNFMLDHQSEKGYIEVVPPYIVNDKSLYGTGQLPKFSEDLFKIEGKDWYLIPTSEVPLTNIHADEILKAEELPKKYTALTPCFRSEAGSHGKDTRGLIRLHQFNKVEMVNIVKQEDSSESLEEMRSSAEEILTKLGLPYRVVTLCSGDIGFGAMKTYDLEVWVPSQDKYREISSCSNCGDFQARRAKIRYKNSEKKNVFAHTLNGSGLAVGRTLVAILENYQQEDGSIIIPEVLRPYMGGLDLIK